MHGRPSWGLSVWGGFICVLLALSSVFHGTPEATALLLGGAVLLFAWAFWLHHGEH